MNTIRDAIIDYGQNFHLGEKEQLKLLLASGTTEQIIAALADMLRNGSNEDIQDAGLAIRDLITMTGHGIGSDFYDAYPGSALVPLLEQMVLSGSSHARSIAIYTLGKTGSLQSLPALRNAIPVLTERDPLMLPKLMFEIHWLESVAKSEGLSADHPASPQT